MIITINPPLNYRTERDEDGETPPRFNPEAERQTGAPGCRRAVRRRNDRQAGCRNIADVSRGRGQVRGEKTRAKEFRAGGTKDH